MRLVCRLSLHLYVERGRPKSTLAGANSRAEPNADCEKGCDHSATRTSRNRLLPTKDQLIGHFYWRLRRDCPDLLPEEPETEPERFLNALDGIESRDTTVLLGAAAMLKQNA